MRPSFALTLSENGIGLLHRTRGGWRALGEVALDDPGLAETLTLLRKTAEDLHDGPILTKLIIPDSQILYTRLPVSGTSKAEKTESLRRGLDGMTPYALDELVFDWREAKGTADLAVVARETLAEAEAFAREHDFNPVCFAAAPRADMFAGEAFFGPTDMAETLLARAEAPKPDRAAPVATEVEADETDNAPRSPRKGQQDTSDAVSLPDAAPEPTVEEPAPELPLSPELPVSPVHAAEETPSAPAKPAEEAAPDDISAAGRPSTTAGADDPQAASPETTASVQPAAPKPAPERKGKSAAKPVAAQPSPAVPASPPKAKPDTGVSPAAKGLPQGPGPANAPAMPAPAQARRAERRDAAPYYGLPISESVTADRRPRIARQAMLGVGLLAAIGLVVLLVTRGGEAPLSTPVPEVAATDPPAELPAPAPRDLAATEPEGAVAPPVQDAMPSEDTAPSPAEDAPVTAEPGQSAQEQETEAEVAMARPSAETPPTPRSATSETAAPASPWQEPPEGFAPPAQGRIDTLYVAAIDPSIRPPQAVKLPDPRTMQAGDPALPMQSEPLPPDRAFVVDRTGLVEATPEGALAPDGIVVYAGRPEVAARLRPAGLVPEGESSVQPVTVEVTERRPEITPPPRPAEGADAEATANTPAQPAEETVVVPVTTGKPARTPPARPADQPASATPTPDAQDDASATAPDEETEALQTEETAPAVIAPSPEIAAMLAPFRPRNRPAALVPAPAAPEAEDVGETAAAEAQRSDLALAEAIRPARRPSDFADQVTAAAPAVPASALVRGPTIPTTASVARRATVSNAINLQKLNLIGVYGSSSDRRALVRLPTGRYVKLKVGDQLDGGRVAAIGDDALRYVKNGRNVVLDLPGG